MKSILALLFSLTSSSAFAQAGTFTGVLYELGGTEIVEIEMRYERVGNRVTLSVADTSSRKFQSHGSGSLRMSGLPVEIQKVQAVHLYQHLYPCAGIINDGRAIAGWVSHASGGILTFHASTVSNGYVVPNPAGFTDTGEKGLSISFTVNYAIN